MAGCTSLPPTSPTPTSPTPQAPNLTAEALLLATRRFSKANFARGQALTNGELSPSEWHLLTLLQHWPDALGAKPSELARRQRVTAANVTHQLRNLESQQLIARVLDVSDRRVVLVKLTPSGEQKLTQVRAAFVQHYEQFITHLGATEADHFIRLLTHAADFLEQELEQQETSSC
jgi:DNA-binding MarR family transcriptional regulator